MTDREKEVRKKRSPENGTSEILGRSKQETVAHNTQRALVLQGGGALAPYEVGVYGALYFWIRKEMSKKGRTADNENIFDITLALQVGPSTAG